MSEWLLRYGACPPFNHFLPTLPTQPYIFHPPLTCSLSVAFWYSFLHFYHPRKASPKSTLERQLLRIYISGRRRRPPPTVTLQPAESKAGHPSVSFIFLSSRRPLWITFSRFYLSLFEHPIDLRGLSGFLLLSLSFGCNRQPVFLFLTPRKLCSLHTSQKPPLTRTMENKKEEEKVKSSKSLALSLSLSLSLSVSLSFLKIPQALLASFEYKIAYSDAQTITSLCVFTTVQLTFQGCCEVYVFNVTLTYPFVMFGNFWYWVVT